MGTRADFYLGRDPKTMVYLGSLGWDGYPSGIMANGYRPDGARVLCADSEKAYLAALGVLQAQASDATVAERDGWPWPWETSATTDYTYAFDGGVVYASIFGGPWFVPVRDGKPVDLGYSDSVEYDLYRAAGKVAQFPDMTDKMNVTFGKRSGLIVLGG